MMMNLETREFNQQDGYMSWIAEFKKSVLTSYKLSLEIIMKISLIEGISVCLLFEIVTKTDYQAGKLLTWRI